MESPTPQVAGSSSEATPAKPAPDAGFTLIEVLVSEGDQVIVFSLPENLDTIESLFGQS